MARAEVGGGLQQAGVVLDQVGVQRQHHERQVGVDDADVHGEVGVEDLQRCLDQAEALQQGIEQAVVAEDAHPGVDADQDRGPGRHHDQQQPHRLHFLAGTADGVGHRVADQQAQQGADGGDLQRAEVGGQVQLVLGEEHVVAEVEQHAQLVVGPADDLAVRRNRHLDFGEADLQHDGERQQEEQQQPEERHADDQLAAGGQQALGRVHDCSTTPLSSIHDTYTGSPQVGRCTWRSALAMNACTTRPEGSSTWYTEWPPR
ncbi:hypothetical protein D3C84_137440 [compost metagenome]